METDKLIEALRNESRYKDKATLKIMDLCMMAADKLEELNNFEQSQSAKLLAQLAEKDKRFAAAVECIADVETYLNLGSAKYIKRTIELWRGPQEAKEVEREKL